MFKFIINMLFPIKCACCSTIIQDICDIHICESCLSKITFYRDDYIIIDDINTIFYDKITSACKYSGILRKSILKYKFGGSPSYYKALAKIMFAKISSLDDYKKAHGFMSIPMYCKKKVQRGYNQAELLSRELSKLAGLPDYSDCIVRTRKTLTQSLLNKEEREINVKDSFQVVTPETLNSKSIILVDDVLTTGSTINECAKELKKVGVAKVYCAVVATGKINNG